MWEVISRLQELEGPQEERVAVLSEESPLCPRLIRLAVEYAAKHVDEVQSRIERNRHLAERGFQAAQQCGKPTPSPSGLND